MRFRLQLISAAMTVIAAFAAPAAVADKTSEAYVETQANAVLKVLNNQTLSDADRRERFSTYMHKFAYVPDIARRVLGPRARTLSQAEFDTYYKAFEQYAIAVYETQLDQFRGQEIKVTGSRDDDPRRSKVTSLIKSARSGGDIEVVWDVLKSKDGTTYRVRDVGLNLDGSIFWLAQEQSVQFQSFLDRNQGDVGKLVKQINQMTADLRARPAGSPSTIGKASP
ncbi:ABC transporter substrate-binding protein [bacterium]|nr:ABC transporter substrate-binding protein [bacterium]